MPPARSYPIRIPTKTYLRKFIEHEVGHTFVSPGSHHIQQFLFIMLEKKYYKYNFTAIAHQYTDSITVQVSDWTFNRIGGGIKQENVVVFNNFVEKLFDRALYEFCRDYVKKTEVMHQTIKQMMSLYNIQASKQQCRLWFKEPTYQDALHLFSEQVLKLEVEKDISFDALKKMEYRARKKFERKMLEPVPQITADRLSLQFPT